MKGKVIYPELSYKIVGILYKVFNELGYGYQEKYYQRAIAVELKNEGFKFVKEKEIKLQYSDQEIGKYFIDFIIEDKIVLELKIGKRFRYKDIQQILAYLKSSKLKLGILVLFTPKGVYYRRILNLTDNK